MFTSAQYDFTIGTNNLKLGEGVLSWSISPVVTCPGATTICRGCCYGCQGRFRKNMFQICYAQNFESSKERGFDTAMIAKIHRRKPKLFRINDIGDFYSENYIFKWDRTVRECPGTLFWAYTRSWRCPELWPALQQLAAEPNMVLHLSLDSESANEFLNLSNGTAHPTAWLATNDDDGPPFPVDVVFRNGWRDLPPLDDLNHFGSPVCPAETGHSKTTCKACQRCFLRRELRAVQALRVQDGGAEQRAVAVEVAGQGGTSDLAEDVARPIRRALSVDG